MLHKLKRIFTVNEKRGSKRPLFLFNVCLCVWVVFDPIAALYAYLQHPQLALSCGIAVSFLHACWLISYDVILAHCRVHNVTVAPKH